MAKFTEQRAPQPRSEAETRLMAAIDKLVADYCKSIRWYDYCESRLTRKGAGIYIQQHGIFTRHSRQMWAQVVANCPELAVRRFIVRENLYEEEGTDDTSHFLMLVRMGVAGGLTAQDVHQAKALPTTNAALLIWETLTKNRHWLVGCAAKSTLEQINQPQCGQYAKSQGEAWVRHLGVSRKDADFWLLHDEMDQVHGSGGFDAVMRFLPQAKEVDESDILQAVENSMAAWKVMLDGIVAAAEAK